MQCANFRSIARITDITRWHLEGTVALQAWEGSHNSAFDVDAPRDAKNSLFGLIWLIVIE